MIMWRMHRRKSLVEGELTERGSQTFALGICYVHISVKEML